MLVLVLDTATAAVVVGLGEVHPDAVTVRAEGRVDGPARHGESVAPLIRAVLGGAGVTAGDLGAVVVGTGPGPYTGLRVGLVSAAAFGDALRIPVYAVGSLDAVAAGVGPSAGPLYVATDARRREVYWARYVDGVRTDGPHVDLPAVLAGRVAAEPEARVVGGGAVLYDLPGAVDAGPTPAGLLAAGLDDLRAGTVPGPLRAEYLRRPDATEPTPRTPAATAAP